MPKIVPRTLLIPSRSFFAQQMVAKSGFGRQNASGNKKEKKRSEQIDLIYEGDRCVKQHSL